MIKNITKSLLSLLLCCGTFGSFSAISANPPSFPLKLNKDYKETWSAAHPKATFTIGEFLLWAIQENRSSAIKDLVDNNSVDINKRIGAEGKECVTPLFLAVQLGHVDCVKELLRHPCCDLLGADAQGNTPLHIATQMRLWGCIVLLLTCSRSSIDVVNAINNDGNTPLYLTIIACGQAVDSKQKESLSGVVRLLLDCGAWVNLVNYKGQRALDIAYGFNLSGIVQLLKDRQTVRSDLEVPEVFESSPSRPAIEVLAGRVTVIKAACLPRAHSWPRERNKWFAETTAATCICLLITAYALYRGWLPEISKFTGFIRGNHV